jgi:hypothetical protein
MWSDDRPDVELSLEDRLDCRRGSGAAGGAWASWAWAGQPFVVRRDAPDEHAGAASSGRAFDMSDRDRRGSSGSGNERMKRRSLLDAGFDRWLHRRLHELYDPVLEEPVPEIFTSLIEAFDRKPDGDDKDEPRGEG